MFSRMVHIIVVGVALAYALATNAHERDTGIEREQGRPIDLVIALDVSGSMEGLIESAKQRLWDVVNELAQAQAGPDLRLAIVTYGNPDYGADTGFVRINQPFTRDLDAVMESLFSFGTNGGDEYVARAIHTSVTRLAWSQADEALKIIFVAGNEAADQDPAISLVEATQAAAGGRIIVSTLYCGNEGDQIVAGWQQVSRLGNGLFASIDQDAAAVANIATPMDQALAQLNDELNATYVVYGTEGQRYRSNQEEQDRNARELSLPSSASRVVAKAGRLYRNENWDLVDAVDGGLAIESVEEEELPAEMRSMTSDEREAYLEGMSNKRREVQARIAELADERQDYIASERKKRAGEAETGLDEAMLDGIRTLARHKGFEIE